MPTTISKYAAYISIIVILISIAGIEWIPWYLYLSMSIIIFLFWYNIYLFFKRIYDDKNWRSSHKFTFVLANFSGLYVGAGVTPLRRVTSYFNSEFNDITIIQVITDGMSGYIAGFIAFYYFIFILKIAFRYLFTLKFFDF